MPRIRHDRPVLAKKTLVDHVLFKLPRDRELLFASAVILQKWVNNYSYRMSLNDVSQGKVRYELQYIVDVKPDDWALLIQLGLFLETLPLEGFSAAIDLDAVFDFSDESLLSYQHSGKHAYQICGMRCGEDGEPYKDKAGNIHKAHLPEIKQALKPRLGEWYQYVPVEANREYVGLEMELSEKVILAIQASELQYSSYVLPACWQSYALVAMGLPVIEILPVGRSLNWLSKWASPTYRVVEQGPTLRRQIENAKLSIQEYELCRSIPEAVDQEM